MPNQKKKIEDEKGYTRHLIEDIVERYPKRRATSNQEHAAQKRMFTEFEKVGLETEEQTFRYSDHLYANLVLHFGVAVAGTTAYPNWPKLALALHSLAFISYFLDSTHKMYILRRLFPWGESRNVLGVLPATKPLKMRFVFLAHIDAAFTGWIFHPKVVRSSAKPLLGLTFLKKQLALVMVGIFGLIGLDLLVLVMDWWHLWLAWVLTIPALIAALLNLQIVAHNETVPGACDDLSGVSALPILTSRLAQWKPDDVELVFVTTGAEEASLGGSDALARARRGDWETSHTIVIALDGLSGGQLQYLEEGELFPIPFSQRLKTEIKKTISSEERFQEIKPFMVPVGASDALSFVSRGYDAVCLSCVDLDLGAPRNYHLPSDLPEHLDHDKIIYCIDFTECLVQHIYQNRKS